MRPTLFELGGVGVSSYSLLLVAAVSVLIAVSVTVAARRSLPGHHVAVATTLGYLGGLAGGRIAWILQNWDAIADRGAVLLSPQLGGLTVYGGLLGGGVTAGAYALALRLPLGRLADAAVLGLGLAAAVGRLGCLLGGCCYGRPTELAWGLIFPAGSPAALRWGTGVPVHPSQLYEAVVLVALAVVCHSIGSRRPPGQGFACLVLGYAVFRFGHEFLRGDSAPALFGLTPPQWISLALAAAAGSFLAIAVYMKRRTSNHEIDQPLAASKPCPN